MSQSPEVIVPMADCDTNGIQNQSCSSTKPSTVAFCNICYRVKTKSGFIGCRKIIEKEILKDIKYVHLLRPLACSDCFLFRYP